MNPFQHNKVKFSPVLCLWLPSLTVRNLASVNSICVIIRRSVLPDYNLLVTVCLFSPVLCLHPLLGWPSYPSEALSSVPRIVHCSLNPMNVLVTLFRLPWPTLGHRWYLWRYSSGSPLGSANPALGVLSSPCPSRYLPYSPLPSGFGLIFFPSFPSFVSLT